MKYIITTAILLTISIYPTFAQESKIIENNLYSLNTSLKNKNNNSNLEDISKKTSNGENTEHNIEIITSIYDRPYSFSENIIDYRQLKGTAYTMLGASVLTLGFLYLMPESFTNWDKDDTSDIFGKWWDNVSEGPVVDKDDFILNYVAHPYCGAVYYMAARSAGANGYYSFLYSFVLSTFFWEYGIEAFAEVPSVQDLIVTPVIGSVFGEGFYLAKRKILENNHRLLNSKFLGYLTVWLMDPITEATNLFLKKSNKKNEDVAVFSYPTVTSKGDLGYNIILSFKF